MPLPESFFQQSTESVARQLIGCRLMSRIGRRKTGGRIVETEAYLASRDPASHGTRGLTQSNAAMFGPAGHAYVYPIHAGWCFNVTTGPEGQASAVLIRSIEPEFGVATMRERRNRSHLTELTAGPSRLCQALAIDRDVDHWNLNLGRRVWIEAGNMDEGILLTTERIGVTSAKRRKLRYLIRDNPFVSGPKWLRTGNGRRKVR